MSSRAGKNPITQNPCRHKLTFSHTKRSILKTLANCKFQKKSRKPDKFPEKRGAPPKSHSAGPEAKWYCVSVALFSMIRIVISSHILILVMIKVILVVILIIFKNSHIVLIEIIIVSQNHSTLDINFSTNDDRQNKSNTCRNNRTRNGIIKVNSTRSNQVITVVIIVIMVIIVLILIIVIFVIKVRLGIIVAIVMILIVVIMVVTVLFIIFILVIIFVVVVVVIIIVKF